MKYRIRHVTTYQYAEMVSLCHNAAHLSPRTHGRQRTTQEDLWIQPEPGVLERHLDYFGNIVHFFTIQEPHRQLCVTAHHRVEIAPSVPLDPLLTPVWDEATAMIRHARDPESLDAYQYSFDSPFIKKIPTWLDYARPSFPPGQRLWAGVLDLMARIHRDFVYDPQATTIATPLHEVFARKRGVCQDFAHLQIACLRSLGIPARYVSGYLETVPPAGRERLIGADASHAWLQVYCPGHGWHDADPTNNLPLSNKHILLAWGRDYDDVSPLKGIILGGGSHTVTVAVDVIPLKDE